MYGKFEYSFKLSSTFKAVIVFVLFFFKNLYEYFNKIYFINLITEKQNGETLAEREIMKTEDWKFGRLDMNLDKITATKGDGFEICSIIRIHVIDSLSAGC